jgi:hypothetical protein
VITPGTTTVVSFRVVSPTNVSYIGGNAADFGTPYAYPWIDVEELTKSFNLANLSTVSSLTVGGDLIVAGTATQGGVSLRTKKTKILNHVIAASTSGDANVSAWSASYTASGGAVEVTAQIGGYSTSGSAKSYYLQRDGVTVDTGTFFFNQANVHTVFPTLCYITSAETGTHTYSIRIGTGITVDSDTCLMVVTEY